MSAGASFRIAPNWKQVKSPSTAEWVSTVRCEAVQWATIQQSKEQTTDTCYDVDGPWKHVTWKQPHSKDHVLHAFMPHHIHLRAISRNYRFIGSEGRSVAAVGLGAGAGCTGNRHRERCRVIKVRMTVMAAPLCKLTKINELCIFSGWRLRCAYCTLIKLL